jgi:2-hydroxychromene-2-carboxylate isomerase
MTTPAPTASPVVEFWYDFASTYSYIAAFTVEAAAKTAGVTVHWRPFLLGPIFAAQGWRDSPFNLYPAKGLYMWRDMVRLCARHALPLVHPSGFPRHSVLAARMALALPPETCPAFTRAVYAANFAHNRDIADPEVLGTLLAALGEAPEAVLARAQSDPVREALRAQTARAQSMGLFGAPSFTVGEEIFWGQDRLDDALAWACEPGLNRP